MFRKIIRIDQEKCVGCGACAEACHEGAIEMVNGKAQLTREDYCDGLGDCLPACPADAISFEEREAPAYDAAAVQAAKQEKEAPLPCGCAGTHVKAFERAETTCCSSANTSAPSLLSNWPVQIKLVPIKAPYFLHADLLVAADCTAYAYGSFHQEFIRNRITLIGCPKLDGVDYTEKLTSILAENDIRSVHVLRMEVPCCGGLEKAVRNAVAASGKNIPYQVKTVSTDGRIL